MDRLHESEDLKGTYTGRATFLRGREGQDKGEWF